MKKRIILGMLIVVAISVIFSGTALAKASAMVEPPGDNDTEVGRIIEWNILPDGRIDSTFEFTSSDGFGGAIIEVGKDGEPILNTFDSEQEFLAAQEARGWKPVSINNIIKDNNINASDVEPVVQRAAAASNQGHVGIVAGIRNSSGTQVNSSSFLVDYSFTTTHVTYYWKHPYSFSQAAYGWSILSGPNYTAPAIPSTNALGTYNTSFAKGSAYNWISLRNRAKPNGGLGYGVSGYQTNLASGYYVVVSKSAGPGWF